MKIKLLIVTLLYFSTLFWGEAGGEVCAQDKQLNDSLQNQLAKHNALKLKLGKNAPAMFDTTAANILYELSKANWYTKQDKAINYANQSQIISKQIGYKKGEGFAIYSIGVCCFWKTDYQSAMTYTNKSLSIGKDINNKKLMASSYVNLGIIYYRMNDNPEALKNLLTALKLGQEIQDTEIIKWSISHIGTINGSIGNYSEALKYFTLILNVSLKSSDKFDIADTYGAMGFYLTKLGNYKEAEKNNLKALELYTELDDTMRIADIIYALGENYMIEGNYHKASKFYIDALKTFQELGNQEMIARIYESIGRNYINLKKYEKALPYLNTSLTISKELGILDNINLIYEDFISVDSAQGKFSEAFKHYKLFISTRDSLNSIANSEKVTQQLMQYEFDKKQLADSLNFTQEKEIGAIKLQKQKAYTMGGIGGLAIAIILLFFVYTNYNKQRLANQKLKEAQQQLIQIEREKEAENIRLRISRDIHDDIGHSLTKISLLSDMTASDKQINSPEAIETLGRISDYSRNVNSSLSEIVWAISPKHDSLDSLIVYMRNHIHRFFENTGITYQINFPDAYENRAINPELKRNIFLVLKESLNNILKYAKAKNVTVDFQIDGDQFELKIKDDGVGFTPLSSGEGQGLPAGQAGVRTGGNGLPNMKHRIEQTGGSFEINSSVGSGCEIIANGKLV